MVFNDSVVQTQTLPNPVTLGGYVNVAGKGVAKEIRHD